MWTNPNDPAEPYVADDMVGVFLRALDDGSLPGSELAVRIMFGLTCHGAGILVSREVLPRLEPVLDEMGRKAISERFDSVRAMFGVIWDNEIPSHFSNMDPSSQWTPELQDQSMAALTPVAQRDFGAWRSSESDVEFALGYLADQRYTPMNGGFWADPADLEEYPNPLDVDDIYFNLWSESFDHRGAALVDRARCFSGLQALTNRYQGASDVLRYAVLRSEDSDAIEFAWDRLRGFLEAPRLRWPVDYTLAVDWMEFPDRAPEVLRHLLLNDVPALRGKNSARLDERVLRRCRRVLDLAAIATWDNLQPVFHELVDCEALHGDLIELLTMVAAPNENDLRQEYVPAEQVAAVADRLELVIGAEGVAPVRKALLRRALLVSSFGTCLPDSSAERLWSYPHPIQQEAAHQVRGTLKPLPDRLFVPTRQPRSDQCFVGGLDLRPDTVRGIRSRMGRR